MEEEISHLPSYKLHQVMAGIFIVDSYTDYSFTFITFNATIPASYLR